MNGEKSPLIVHCYAGYRDEQTPQDFIIDDRRVAVTALLYCWLSPEHRYFKVKGDDHCTYFLRHDCTTRGVGTDPCYALKREKADSHFDD